MGQVLDALQNMRATWQHTLGTQLLRGQSHDSPVTPQPALSLSTLLT